MIDEVEGTDRYPSMMVPALVAQLFRGFAMGAADIVPGVSGGTIALLFGIYQRLIGAVRTGAQALGRLVSGDLRGAVERLKAVDWAFLVPLLAGIGIAVITLARLIETLLHDHPEEMAGLFLGLVAASVLVAQTEMRRWATPTIAVAIVVAVATFLLLGLESGTVADPPLLAYLVAGAIAICAMILPGVSGSFLLLMMGMYAPLLAAVNDRDLLPVAVFMVGATVGLAVFSTLLHRAIQANYDLLLAALIGLMAGSVRVLWPWPNGVGIISDEADEVVSGTVLGWPTSFADFLMPTLLAIGAFVAVLVLVGVSNRSTSTSDPLAVT